MAASTSQTPVARKAAAAQQSVLEELVGIAARHASESLMDMVGRMVSALLDMTAAGQDAQTAARRIRSGNLLRDNAYAFVHIASTGIELALRKEVAQLAPALKPAAAQPLALSLVPMEEMDTQLAFAAISRPFDIQHAERIATLGARLGVLLGRDLVRATSNPFRPEVFLRALREAWQEFEPETEAHALINPLLGSGIVFDLAPLFEALNDKLKPARRGEDERFAKTDDSAAARAARARRDAAVTRQLRQLFGTADADGAALDIPEIPNLPQGTGGWRPSGASGFAVAPAPEALVAAPPAAAGPALAATSMPAGGFAWAPQGGALPANATMATITGMQAMGAPTGAPRQLIDLLDKLAGAMPFAGQPGGAAQGPAAASPHGVFYLPRLKQSLPQGSLSRGDETTLDLLSRVFEAVLLDESIPQETRELIAFLQVPVLKAALKDRSFFFEETHPARRMIDLLSNAGWEQPRGAAVAADDPVYRAMRRGVERVRAEAQPGDSAVAFADAVAELEASLAEREHAEQAAIAGPIAQATRQEKQLAASRSAHRAVQLRLAGEQVVALIGTFLEQRWIPVLTLAYSIEDSKPGAIDNATRAMDDLVWSVKPKATQEQRKALIKRLPALLTTLNKWLDAVKWQDAERLQFFAELAECHASIVRAPVELSPERQLELAVEAAQQDAMRRIAQEQLAAEQEAPAAPPDPDAASLASLVRGMRVEFSGTGGVRKLKLSWISPLRTLFIFSGAGRQEAFSLPAERLLEAFRAGSIRVLAPEGVVGRVLTQAAGEAAMNDPGSSVQSA